MIPEQMTTRRVSYYQEAVGKIVSIMGGGKLIRRACTVNIHRKARPFNPTRTGLRAIVLNLCRYYHRT
eukprot:6458210-Amphidinium_carterae.3